MIIDVSEDDINDQLNAAAESANSGVSRWPGMSYEQGVEAGIAWILGYRKEKPMDD